MWLVYGAWSWLIVSSLVIFNTRGDVAAANHALPSAVLVLILHGGVWLYKRNKRSTPIQEHAAEPKAPLIDDAIYDQVADEMSKGDINGGLMARAIAESDGDKDRTQAIYIKLRTAAVAKERDQIPDAPQSNFADGARHSISAMSNRSNQIQTDAEPIVERLFILVSLALIGGGAYITILTLISGNHYSEIWGGVALASIGAVGIKKLRW